MSLSGDKQPKYKHFPAVGDIFPQIFNCPCGETKDRVKKVRGVKIGRTSNTNYCKVLVSGGNQGKVPVSGLSGEFGSTCVVDGPNTWEATDGHGPGDVRVGWRMIEGLVA